MRQPTAEEALIGWDRYETLRRLSPRAFGELWQQHLTSDKSFDELVDDLKPFLRPTFLNDSPPSDMVRPIDDLEFTVRTSNTLKAGGVYYVFDLTRKTEPELKRFPNLGVRALTEIKAVLSSHGLSLGMPL